MRAKEILNKQQGVAKGVQNFNIGYHVTKKQNVPSIMKNGLRGGKTTGFTLGGEWADAIYGKRPVYVALDKGLYKDTETTELKIDLRGLRLVPDLSSLIDLGAMVSDNNSIYWKHDEDIPKLLMDYAEDGEIFYDDLLKNENVIRAAILSTRTAAILDSIPANKISNNQQGVAEGKVKLYTDPNYFGAEVDDAGFDSLPVINIPLKNLIGFEPDKKMQEPKAKANVKKILAGLAAGDNIPAILVRKYKDGYQVLDGHHRFWAYKVAKKDTIPARVVDPKDIEEISKQDVVGNISEANSDLNSLHNKKAYQQTLQVLQTAYGDEEGQQMLDQYIQAVDQLIHNGGTIYRGVWVAPGTKPRLKDAGQHWTLTAQAAEEYLDSNAGWSAYADFQSDNKGIQPVPYIISAHVGPNSITNNGVFFAEFPEEMEVRLVNPQTAKMKIVKKVEGLVTESHHQCGQLQLRAQKQQSVAEGSLNEFAPGGFNGGDDDEFSPVIAKIAEEDGFTKGVVLADGATLELAITINQWHNQHGGMYKQYFAKGFKEGRMEKIRYDNKQYNLNLKLMKDGSIRHGEQGLAEAWSEKYKKSINCKNPKGLSQRAHCQGRKKNNEEIELDERKRKRKKKTARYYYGPAYFYGTTDTGGSDSDGA